MRIINNVIFSIFLNEKDMNEVNKIKMKTSTIVFICNIFVIPFLMNLCSLYLAHRLSMNYVLLVIELLLWNIVINVVLGISLFAILYVKQQVKDTAVIKCIYSMNFINPIVVLLGLFVHDIFVSLAIIIYDYFFITKYLSVSIVKNQLQQLESVLIDVFNIDKDNTKKDFIKVR